MSSGSGAPASGSWGLPPTDANLNFISQEYSYEDVRAATDSFSVRCRLGQGTYGSVYQGTLRDGTEVAIKTLSKPNEAGFREEVEVLSRFRHPNLVILMGFARHNKERYLVYELLCGGDVCARLQKDGAFSWRPRLSVALDAALGLSHLHCSRPQVFHRDIKSQNILMDRNGTGKMADFGLALLAQPDCTSLTVEHTSGTIGYADPLYIRTGVVTERSEVYSFGMVLLEVLTGRPPALQHASGRIEYQFNHINGEVARVRAMLDIRGQWPAALALGIGKLALRCIDENETLRPTFVEIVGILRQLLTTHPENRANDTRLGAMSVPAAPSVTAAGAGTAAANAAGASAVAASAAAASAVARGQWQQPPEQSPLASSRAAGGAPLVQQVAACLTGDPQNPFAIGSRAGPVSQQQRPLASAAAASSHMGAEQFNYGVMQGTGLGGRSGVFGSGMGASSTQPSYGMEATQSSYALDGLSGHSRQPPAFVPSNGVGIDPTAPVGSFSQAGIGFQVGASSADAYPDAQPAGVSRSADAYFPAAPSWSSSMPSNGAVFPRHGPIGAERASGVQVGTVAELEPQGLPELRPVDFGDPTFTDSGPVAVLDCGSPPEEFAHPDALQAAGANLQGAAGRAGASKGTDNDVWIDPRLNVTLDGNERARQSPLLLPEHSPTLAQQPGLLQDGAPRYGGQLDANMLHSAHLQRLPGGPSSDPDAFSMRKGGQADVEPFLAPWALHQARPEAMAAGPGRPPAPATASPSPAAGSEPKPGGNPDQEVMMLSLQHEMGFTRTQVVEAFKRCSTAEAAIEWILSPERDWGE